MRRRKIRRRKLRNQNRVLIISVLTLTLFIGIGYAAFQTIININVKGTIKEYDKINLYVSSSGSDVTGRGTIKRPYATIQKAYDEASDNSNIFIMTDIIQNETININSNKVILLTSYNKGESNFPKVILRASSLTNNIINQTSGKLTLKNIIIDGNNIETDYSIINIEKETLIEEGTIIKNGNNKNTFGGGVQIKESGIVTINGGEMFNNYAQHGGAISNEGSLIINNVYIHNNNSGNNGGGLYTSGKGILEINNIKIEKNNAQYGGGIAAYGKETIIRGGIIAENNATTDGGGIRTSADSSLKIYNVSITNNRAYNGGGILLYRGSNITMYDGTISGNQASNVGGGVYIGCGQTCPTFTLEGGTIKNNIASVSNGGIAISNGGIFTNNGGIICENTPANSYETHQACPN